MSKGTKLALEIFGRSIQTLGSEQEISEFAQTMATISIKVIHGIEGREFKEGLLSAAREDQGMIRVIRPH